MRRTRTKPSTFGAKMSEVIGQATIFSDDGQLLGVMNRGEWLPADRLLVARARRPGVPSLLIRRQRVKARIAADGSVAFVAHDRTQLEAVWTKAGQLAGAMDRGTFIDREEMSVVVDPHASKKT
jgi:hypothetical protein